MKFVSFCVERDYRDEYMQGFSVLKKRPDFFGIAYPDRDPPYRRIEACRLKPKFIAEIFEEHAPFLYVDSDTKILRVPEIPLDVDVGICLNPVQAATGIFNDKWIFSASCFYLGRTKAAADFVARWNGLMRNKCGDHQPFMQSIKGARDITKYLAGTVAGFHRDKYYTVQYNARQAVAGRQWL